MDILCNRKDDKIMPFNLFDVVKAGHYLPILFEHEPYSITSTASILAQINFCYLPIWKKIQNHCICKTFAEKITFSSASLIFRKYFGISFG
jgi:hypothetical protein